MSRLIERYETIDSTMRRAAELAESGSPSGTAVVAAEQTAGYGRYGRTWHSARHDGLYVSVVLRIAISPANLPVTTLAIGLATQEAIEKTTRVHADLRWPNDVIIGGRKCAGILTEVHGGAIITGIGVNVGHKDFPEDIVHLATSLYRETGRAHDTEALLDQLLASIDKHIEIFTTDGPQAIIEAFSNQSTYASGRHVAVDLAGDTIEGTTAGLTSEGFLTVVDSTGRRHTIIAGGVRATG
jgi:BirA family biotin operon repressor/biotin-[acetyl-CoA-carboxylase] ligase